MDDKKNTLWQLIQFTITLVIALIILKINLNHFGVQIFGIWIMLAAVWGVGSALDFGFGISIIKYVAEFKKHDDSRLNSFLSSSFYVFAIIGVAIFTLLNIVSYFLYFNKGIVIPTNFVKSAQKISFILGLAFYFQYLNIFFKSFFEGLSNFTISSKITIVQNILLLSGVILVSLLKLSIVDLALTYLICYFITLLLSLFIFKKYFSLYKINIKYFHFLEVKKIISFSFSVQTISIFSALIDPTIKYIIGNFYNISFIPFYEIARRFAIAISQMFFTMFRTILPRASVCKSKSEMITFFNDEVSKISKLGIIYSGLFFGILATPLMLLLKTFFNNDVVLLIFLILALPETINNFGYAVYIFILGIGKAYYLSIIHIINLIITVIGVIIGFYIFNSPLGLLGYFLSVVIGNIIMLLFIKKNIFNNIKLFFQRINIQKLLILIMLLFTNVIILNFYPSLNVVLFPALSILSFLLFFKDLKILYFQVYTFIKQNPDINILQSIKSLRMK